MAQSVEQLKAQKAKYQAKIRQLEAAERKLKRKQDAHNKIVVGATIMAALKEYDLTDKEVLDKLVGYINDQREWIGKWIAKN